jgi:thiol-disulfide isomerase/thioredoxin
MGSRKARRVQLREERLAHEADAETRRSRQRHWKLGGVGVLFLLDAAIIGVSLALGGSNEHASSQPPLTRQEIASAPKRLQANLAQANQLVDGSIETRLAGLRGVPVVVNQWASWCPNCRSEFPFFQHLSREFRDKVAFIGLDSQDDRGAAEDFLKQFPVPYPSIFDSSADEAVSIGGGQGWPTTIYFDRRGGVSYVRPGGYASQEQLRADIQRYALAQGG